MTMYLRLAQPGQRCFYCGAVLGTPITCPDCGWVDPPAKKKDDPLTRESHDPLASLARQNLATHLRRLGDAAIKAAAELVAEDTDPDVHLLEVGRLFDRSVLAHRSLTATRLGRERAAAKEAEKTARRRRGER